MLLTVSALKLPSKAVPWVALPSPARTVSLVLAVSGRFKGIDSIWLQPRNPLDTVSAISVVAGSLWQQNGLCAAPPEDLDRVALHPQNRVWRLRTGRVFMGVTYARED